MEKLEKIKQMKETNPEFKRVFSVEEKESSNYI